jgi:hypothetical protein
VSEAVGGGEDLSEADNDIFRLRCGLRGEPMAIFLHPSAGTWQSSPLQPNSARIPGVMRFIQRFDKAKVRGGAVPRAKCL